MDVLVMLNQDRRTGARESRSVAQRFVALVLESETTPVRFFLALYYFAHAGAFFFNAPGCPYDACVFIESALSWQTWAFLFLAQGCASLWRVLDGKNRPAASWMVHGSSVLLLGGYAAANVIARWPYWVLSVPNLVVVLAALWVCARIAINPGRGFYGD
jgi:hypothetical protein